MTVVSTLNLAGFDYQTYIQSKETFKNKLLEVGVGFDGDIQFPFCFKAFYDFTDELVGTAKISFEGLFAETATFETNFTNVDGCSALLNVNLDVWNIDITDPTKIAAKNDTDRCRRNSQYDPYMACTPDSAVSDRCNQPPNGYPIGDISQQYCFDSGEVEETIAAPRLADYYFKTGYNTWSGLNFDCDYNFYCAKLIPVDCITDELTPINPYLQEKLLALAASKSQKAVASQDLLSLLTLGASDQLLGGLSGTNSTNSVLSQLLENINIFKGGQPPMSGYGR